MKSSQPQAKLLRYLLKAASALLLTALATASGASINTNNYEKYMRELVDFSREKKLRYPFAAMIIDNQSGKMLCRGFFEPNVNPTYHGEMVAINNCLAKYPKRDWSKTTIITDAEPCAMCAGAIVWTGIGKTVYGSSVPFFVKHHWKQIGVRAEYVIKNSAFYQGTIMGGILHQETDKLFAEAYQSK